VLSGLSQIQIGFENLLKNGFEKLEKKKKMENQLISVSAQLSRSPPPQPASARPTFSPPALRSRSWAEPRPPAQLAARALLSLYSR
jgi:hypothetical protein